MANEYFKFNEQSCHGLPEFITGLTYQLPTGVGNTIFIDLNSIVTGFYNR